jgi:methionyl-tRNA synthetase
LRIGIIRSAERLPKSKKLLHLRVDIGLEERSIVAGIGASYIPESLIGQHVVVIANLKSAKLLGTESQGMLLAAKDGDQVLLIGGLQCPAGSEVS